MYAAPGIILADALLIVIGCNTICKKVERYLKASTNFPLPNMSRWLIISAEGNGDTGISPLPQTET